MKIVLISPSQGDAYGKLPPPEYPPLGLGYLAAVLENDGHAVRIIDADAEQLDDDAVVLLLAREKPDLVGITATTPLYQNALVIAGLVKNNSSAVTLLGGMHASLLPGECALNAAIDFVVVGEGEKTIVELAACLESGGDFSRINGLVYKRNGEIVQNETREVIQDLDSLPFPARHLFRSHRYAYPDALRTPAFPIITSRGCPATCTFCTAQYLHGRQFRFRSAENVLDEIEMLIGEHGAREIHIWDDNFITNRDRVFAFRDGIISRKIRIPIAFPNGVRADFITKEILTALREAGTYSIAIGVESGNQTILDSIHKGLRLEQIETAFRLAKEAGLETWGFFLLGLPGEDNAKINETLEFALRLDPCIAKFHILKPFPKSAVHEQLKSQGLIMDEDYAHYGFHTGPVHRLSSLSQEQLLEWQRSCYRRFYMRPSKMIKSLARIKSLHRLKRNLSTGWALLKNKML